MNRVWIFHGGYLMAGISTGMGQWGANFQTHVPMG